MTSHQLKVIIVFWGYVSLFLVETLMGTSASLYLFDTFELISWM